MMIRGCSRLVKIGGRLKTDCSVRIRSSMAIKSLQPHHHHTSKMLLVGSGCQRYHSPGTFTYPIFIRELSEYLASPFTFVNQKVDTSQHCLNMSHFTVRIIFGENKRKRSYRANTVEPKFAK